MISIVEYIDHTGDTGIVVTADTLEQVFITAAKSMFHMICPQKVEKPEITKTISFQSDDLEQMMVNWLSELNYLFQTESFLLGSIADIHFSNNVLSANVSGESLDCSRHEIHMEIKAVTYHDIYVKPVNGSWQARIIFDI